MKYLINTTEVYRVDSESGAQTLIEEAKAAEEAAKKAETTEA